MEILFSDEMRLVYALLLQAAILTGSWRFVRRRAAGDWADRAADVLLLGLLVQYASVALPGVMGILSPVTIAIATLIFSVALFFAPVTLKSENHGQTSLPMPPDPGVLDRWMMPACALFALGYMVAINLNQCIFPVMANDALTYHFPAAVQWLQTGRLSLLETWFFNPANTYSPLAGSTFIAWWIAPVGHDALARNVQSPALLLIFFAALRLMRGLGVRASVAAVIALALILARPFVRQSIIEKDDLYLVAFFACVAAGCIQGRLRERLGPWRIGAALGMMLATKYTALLALPALVLLIDAPRKAGWTLRGYFIAAMSVLVIAGPWYLRNLIAYGNPVFPIQVKVLGITLFHGLFASARSSQLASFGSIWSLLTQRDQSLPPAPVVFLLVAILVAAVKRRGQLRSDPLVRLCMLGPPLLLLIFVALSPYAEVRFVYPAFFLLFAAGSIGIAALLRSMWIELLAAVVLLLCAALTTFSMDLMRMPVVLGLFGSGAMAALIGLCFLGVIATFPTRRRDILSFGGIAGVLILAGLIFVSWQSYLKNCRGLAMNCYAPQYGEAAKAWQFVRDQLPATELLAYSNTFYIHPLSGFDNNRPLVYIPTRRGIVHLSDLPPLPGKISGEQLVPAMAAALTSDTDAAGWLPRLTASGATHLILFRSELVARPPELGIIEANPGRFEEVFRNEVARVYRVRG